MQAILAHDKNGGIGFKNSLPWGYNREDMQHFVNITRGKPVVMGYKTFESLGCKPLPKRRNIVLTRSKREQDGVEFMTLEEYMSMTCLHETAVIIGGGEIYKLLIPLCDTLYITVFNEEYECDTFIDPDIGLSNFPRMESTFTNNEITIFKYTNHDN